MILLAVAPNGARITKEDLPTIPLTAEEIGIDAKACQQAGASMIHLHIRNSKGKHSLNSGYYKEAIQQINEQTGNKLFIQVTSEAVGRYTPEEQFEMIYSVKPQGVSIGIREIKNLDELDVNEHFNWMRDHEVCPQLILYNQHDLSIYKNWLAEGVIPGKAYPVLIVIGKHQVEGVFDKAFLETNPDLSASSWMVCAFGDQEYEVGKMAADLKGHVRLGYENNSHLKDGQKAESNAQIISQMAEYLKKQQTEVASYHEACKIMKPDW